MRYIENSAFSGAGEQTSVSNDYTNPSLKIYYEGAMEQWCEINFGHSAFLGNVVGLYINNEQIQHLIIPDSVTEIKANTFSFIHFEHITIGENVKKISSKAFYFSKARSIELNEGLEIIGESAFCYFNGASNMTFPSTLKRIEKYAFSSSDISYVDIPDGVEYIGERTFLSCTDMVHLNIGKGVTYIGNQAFYYSTPHWITMDESGVWDILDLEGNIVGSIEGERFSEISLRMLLGDENSKYAYKKQE